MGGRERVGLTTKQGGKTMRDYHIYYRQTKGPGLFSKKPLIPGMWIAKIRGRDTIIGEYTTEREAIDACADYEADETRLQIENNLGYHPD